MDALVVDTAHGHSKNVLNRVAEIKRLYPQMQVIGGNPKTARMMGLNVGRYVLVACAPEASTAIVEAVRPLLRRHGGVCLVSDAMWLRH